MRFHCIGNTLSKSRFQTRLIRQAYIQILELAVNQANFYRRYLFSILLQFIPRYWCIEVYHLILKTIEEFSLKSPQTAYFYRFYPRPKWENAKNQQFEKVRIWGFRGKWVF
jgi:hypothetical protein